MSWPHQLGRDNVLEHYWFQFLIGNVLAVNKKDIEFKRGYLFQFLIGNVLAVCDGTKISLVYWRFQFLIGNVLALIDGSCDYTITK